jgi:hypothetical protein
MLAAEVLVRLAGVAPEVGTVQAGRLRLSGNPVLVYEGVPGFRDQNSFGFRDRERDVEKRPGTFRIAVVGDSVVAGFKIESYKDVFPAVLERDLRAAGAAVEVISFGVFGYHTEQEVELIRTRLAAFEPDMILLSYCLNDRSRSGHRIVRNLEKARSRSGVLPGALVDGMAEYSALYRLVRFGRVVEPLADTIALGEGDPVAPAFAELERLAATRGFEVRVVVFPVLRGKAGKPLLWDYPKGARREHQRIERLAARHGFGHLDLLDPLRRCAEESGEPVGLDRFHPTVFGHQCAARAIGASLSRDPPWDARESGG